MVSFFMTHLIGFHLKLFYLSWSTGIRTTTLSTYNRPTKDREVEMRLVELLSNYMTWNLSNSAVQCRAFKQMENNYDWDREARYYLSMYLSRTESPTADVDTLLMRTVTGGE